MIRGLLRLGLLGLGAAWALDRWLGRRAEGGEAEPIVSEILVRAPIERTWEVLADLPGQPAWMTDLRAVEVLTPGPVRVGTRAIGTVRIAGITVDDPVEVTILEPPRRYGIRHEGLFTGSGIISLTPGPGPDTTLVRWEERLVPPVLPHLGAAVQRPILGAIFQADLERFKVLVETAEGAAR